MIIGMPKIDPDAAAVGARLRRWRTERGIDLTALAAALHLSEPEIRLIEAGRERMTSAQVQAATHLLHLPLWALVSDTPAY